MDIVHAAARNNAEWCDAVCRSHGAPTRFDADAWTSATRTPPYYPDAVTLVPDPPVAGILSRVDASTGCSIKDSFASLDLTAHGFRVLFDAEWIVRAPAAARDVPDPRWEQVRAPSALDEWQEAWRDDDAPVDVFRADLLDDDAITVLGARTDGRFVAGAVLNRGASVVGISNVFDRTTGSATGWSGCLAFADALFPGATFVGYEAGADLDDARRHGFATAGPLRVWIKDV